MLTQTQQVGIKLCQLAQTVEALAHAVQRGDADGRHRQGQYQHQGKAQAEFAGHAQVGQHTVLARAHRRFPFCVRGYPEGQGGNVAADEQGPGVRIVSNSYERVVFSLAEVALHAGGRPGHGNPAHKRH